MAEKSKYHRVRIVYSGRVQGVGFRWQVEREASGFEVTGFVRNLSDGTVEMMVEGKRVETCRMIEAVERRLRDYWKSKTEDEREGEPQFDGFSICCL
tara:strand:+ start:904 stop:1194 length:291 start_codon:yes stop_codon:yes gene_type:complete